MKFMLIYGAIMVMGIVVGAKCSWIPPESKIRQNVQCLFLFILLFVLGHQLGSDEAVASSMSEMGFYGLVIAVASMVGSFFFVIALRKIFEQKKESERHD